MEPSIFKVLGDHSGLLCPKLVRAAPSLHDNTVSLFLQHAATHSFFLSSSSLLSPGSTSPTAANFAQLLQTVTRLQSWAALPLASRQQVVKMVGSILTSSKSSAALLSLTPDFHELLDSSISVCYESSELCPDVLENLVTILDDFPLSVPALISVTFLLLHVAKTGSKAAAGLARRLLAKIPPQITFSRERAKQLDCVRQAGNSLTVERALLDIFRLDIGPDTLHSSDFRDFMLYIGGEFRDAVKVDCWRRNIIDSAEEVPGLVLTSERLQTVWLSWAAAQFCVVSKLKTPLGKAQETLGHIDQACRKLAGLCLAKLDMKQAQALLHFGLGLEKAMVNGWEGSVAALPPATRSTQLFFYTNRATCQDWLARLRPSLIRVAFAAGEYCEAVRQVAISTLSQTNMLYVKSILRAYPTRTFISPWS